MPPTVVSLGRMVDLALGTPEVGAVNFNVLHTLLHAVIQKLNIADVTADLPEDEGHNGRANTQSSVITENSPIDFESDSGLTGLMSASDIASDEKSMSIGLKKSSSIPVTRSTYHTLEDKVERLDRQIAGLRALPSTKELMEMTTGSSDQEVNKFPRPVADMWQSMQLSRKVDANTQGVSKLMSLVEDLMREIQLSKDVSGEFEGKLQRLTNDAVDHDKRLTELSNKFDGLEKHLEKYQERLNSLPGDEFMGGFVTWAALEDALNGLRQQFNGQQKETLLDAGNQTDELSRASSRRHSITSTPGPSVQLQDMLERLGRVHELHEALEKRVEMIEVEMKEKDAQSGDINQKLKALMDEFEALKHAQTMGQNPLSGGDNEALEKLQNELDRLKQATERLSDDVIGHGTEIKQLNEQTANLDEKKADKEFVSGEINAKADKAHLDLKVNRNHFDLTCKELNQMISDLINKLLGNEGEWKNVVGQLTSEIDSKMGRLEFGPFRDELERQLRALAGKLSTLQAGEVTGSAEDDAAGIRKQLLQRFHCISCDRPLDMTIRKSHPSLPEQPGLRESRSLRPFLVYDLDQIRQYARSQGTVDGSVADLYATSRQCGGSHTMTLMNRRTAKLQPVREPSYISKNSVSGGVSKLPNLAVPKSKSAYPLYYSSTTNSSQPLNPAPQTTRSNQHPSSARSTSRPISPPSHRPVVTVVRSMTAAQRITVDSTLPPQLRPTAVLNGGSIRQLPALTGTQAGTHGDDELARSSHADETAKEFTISMRAAEDDAMNEERGYGGVVPDDEDRYYATDGYEIGTDE